MSLSMVSFIAFLFFALGVFVGFLLSDVVEKLLPTKKQLRRIKSKRCSTETNIGRRIQNAIEPQLKKSGLQMTSWYNENKVSCCGVRIRGYQIFLKDSDGQLVMRIGVDLQRYDQWNGELSVVYETDDSEEFRFKLNDIEISKAIAMVQHFLDN